MITKDFVVGGKAVFTLENDKEFAQKNGLPKQYTFRVTKKENEGRDPVFFVSLLTGPDNTSDYTYLGLLKARHGGIVLTKNSKMNEKTWCFRLLDKALKKIWSNKQDEIIRAGFDIHHEGKCCKCGRPLTDEKSIKLGIGPRCRGEV